MSYDYIIGAGHTPSGTVGAGAIGTIDESKCTREIAPLIVSKLIAKSKTAKYLVVDKGNESDRADCYSRINQANSDKCGLYVEIHLNAGGGTGVEVLIPSTSSAYTKSIASSICSKISKAFNYTNRGVKEKKLVIFDNAQMPAILIECGFVDSSDANIYDANKYADAISSVLIENTSNDDITNDINSSTNQWIKGWNQDSKGWFYVTDVDKKTYYTSKDGWKNIKGSWYIFDDSGYSLQNTWYKDRDNAWYYLDDDCKMVTSTWVFHHIKNYWYYINSSGQMVTNKWYVYKDKHYYLKEFGRMAMSEWIKYEDKYYYLNENGDRATNQWVNHNNDKYYFDNNGVMVANKTIVIDNTSYTFNEKGILIN